MTARADRLKINNEKLDKRVKLTQLQKEEIRRERKNFTQRQLAEKYGVSKRLIQFILNPDKREENAKKHDWKRYYNKEKHRLAMKRHRARKMMLKKQGLI